MRIEIKGLSELRQRLAQIRPEEIMARALAEQAQRLAEAVQENLSEPQGAGSHDTPWVRTGARSATASLPPPTAWKPPSAATIPRRPRKRWAHPAFRRVHS